jgi:hypothetical protein
MHYKYNDTLDERRLLVKQGGYLLNLIHGLQTQKNFHKSLF